MKHSQLLTSTTHSSWFCASQYFLKQRHSVSGEDSINFCHLEIGSTVFLSVQNCLHDLWTTSLASTLKRHPIAILGLFIPAAPVSRFVLYYCDLI